MRKKVMVKSVPIEGPFYSNNTCYKRKVVLHNNCYDRISKGCFAIGISGFNTDAIVAFNDEALVEIEVPSIKFKDIRIGENFNLNGVNYQRLFFHKNNNMARENNNLYEFDLDTEVERI